MKQLLIALSIPIFVFFILFEVWLSKRRRMQVYRFSDAVTDLGCGVVSQISVFYFQKTLQGAYTYLYDHFRLFTLGEGLFTWIFGFLLLDFLYYWFHRLSHEINLLWAVHIVHHQSEDYNLAVALRQALLTVFVTWFFYVPMAFLGIPPMMFALLHAFNLIYQFWIHTELIRTLGPLEHILNTPSHHRVHHGQNPQYLDKNYSGTLIIWDKLFKTFVKEEEPVVYGITKPLASYNNLWAQYHYYIAIFKEAVAAPKLIDKLKVWFKGPDWSPEGLPPKLIPHGINRETFVKYDPQPPTGMPAYVAFNHLVMSTVAIFVLMLKGAVIPSGPKALMTVFILLSMSAMGAILEKKSWGLRLELFRVGFLPGAAAGASWGTPYFWQVTLGAALLGALSLLWLRSTQAVRTGELR